MTSSEIYSVEFKGITKSFDGVIANSEVSFKVRKGSIHAFIGENGAGKSTAMKILYGIYSPDQGEIVVDGKPRVWKTPSDAIAAGIGMVHQHFMLAEPYSIIENVVLGYEKVPPFFPIPWNDSKSKLQVLAEQYGWALPTHLSTDALEIPIQKLSVGVQQRIEILKLLYRDAQILILDEPTAVLTPQETSELFQNLKKLKSQGKTIIVITHKLKEVLEHSDEITVLKAGKVVGSRKTSETHSHELAQLMVGREVKPPVQIKPSSKSNQAVLSVKSLNLFFPSGGSKRILSDLNFDVREGEVVGIAGVEGNGQSDLLKVLTHPKELSRQVSGEVWCLGRETLSLSTQEIKKLGVGIIPEDRHKQGLLLEKSLKDNFLLGLHRRVPFVSKGCISEKELQKAVLAALDEFDIRPRDLEIPVSKMSGGNQQKVIIAREFFFSPRFLIAAQPTRGVDIGAIELIHQRILKAKSEGTGVLLISSELDEILQLSDRILVLFEGKIVAQMSREDAKLENIGLWMAGGGEAV